MTRFEYPLEIFDSYYGGGATATFDFWWIANDPAWYATFPDGADGVFGFNLSSDYTAVPNIIGWQVEIDVASGTGTALWDLGFDNPAGDGYFAFKDTFTIDGPGTYVSVAGDPYIVHLTTYGGVYDVLARVANEVGYPHGYGTLDVYAVGGAPIVLNGMRVIFFTADVAPVVRQLRRGDGLGQASVARHGAATNSVTRVIGGPP